MLSARAFRAGRLLQSVAVRSRANNVIRFSNPMNLQAIRAFSNEDFKQTLNKVKEGYKNAEESTESKTNGVEDEGKNEEAKDSENATNTSKEEGFKLPKIDMYAIRDFTRSSYDFVVDNVRQAYAEMMGEGKESNLSRKVHQAESFRRAAVKEEEEDEDLTEAEREAKEAKAREEAGPSAIVLVKDPKSAWESMRERLADSPLIREMLKNSRKIGQQAASTDIGKKAVDMGKSVQDKISDVREVWETSQNPIVYTLSGVWDSLTGETEEGVAIAEIRKLDPKFVKVLSAHAVLCCVLLNCTVLCCAVVRIFDFLYLMWKHVDSYSSFDKIHSLCTFTSFTLCCLNFSISCTGI